jgi:hypothetical protein
MAKRKFNQSGGEVNTDERRIHWLASYPKSGNTWVRMFLNSYATGFTLDINSAHQFITSDLRPELFQTLCPRPLFEMSFREQLMYQTAAMLNLLKMSPSTDAYVKTHNANAIVETFKLIEPAISGTSIYIIRDPRDVAISMTHHFEKSTNEIIDKMADEQHIVASKHNLHHVLLSWSTHVKSWTSANKTIKTLVIKYEDMLDYPIKVFSSVLNILEMADIDDAEERFNFALEQSSFAKLKAKEEKDGFSERMGKSPFFRSGKKKQWRKILSPRQISKIESDHKEVMKQYGYL